MPREFSKLEFWDSNKNVVLEGIYSLPLTKSLDFSTHSESDKHGPQFIMVNSLFASDLALILLFLMSCSPC